MSSSATICLVDHDFHVRKALTDFLSSNCFETTSFASADAYLNHHDSWSCSCLIVDMNLPGMSGLELQRKVRETTDPSVIFITGDHCVPVAVTAMKEGAVELLMKPIDADALLRAVNYAILRHKSKRQRKMELNVLRRRLASLTPRELEVLPVMVGGLPNKQAAALLQIAEVTLQIHRAHVLRKMEAKSIPDLVRMSERLSIRPVTEDEMTPVQIAQ